MLILDRKSFKQYLDSFEDSQTFQFATTLGKYEEDAPVHVLERSTRKLYEESLKRNEEKKKSWVSDS